MYANYNKRKSFISGRDCIQLQLEVLKLARAVSPTASCSLYGIWSISPSYALKNRVGTCTQAVLRFSLHRDVLCGYWNTLFYEVIIVLSVLHGTCGVLWRRICHVRRRYTVVPVLNGLLTCVIPIFASAPFTFLPGLPLLLFDPLLAGSSSVVPKCMVVSSNTSSSCADTESANE